ncbi:MAG: hypothetical protein FJ293_00545 [Planctomycetes bacterium]|nr:hypothetical protein [Planctomycetota bacterium]
MIRRSIRPLAAMAGLIAFASGCGSRPPDHGERDASLQVARAARHPGATWSERLDRAAQSDESWRARSDEIRTQILVASGLWPEPERPPVHARLSGRVERDGYSVERVEIETLPGFMLTGTLYRPRDGGGARHPAIATPHGHWADGRFTDHDRCSIPGRSIQFAKLGIVTIAYDMVGYGDLKALGHDFGDAPWGFSLQGLQLWNSIRVVDFLCSLPDVDPERIGATGASGGGTQTFLLAAVDPRVKVAAPVNMVAAGFQGGCLCENAPLLRLDLNNVEIAAAIAPRPLLLISCTGDWTHGNLELEAPALARVYAARGAPERFRAAQVDAGHNYNQDTREIAYAWFAQWLLGAPPAERIAEAPFVAEPRESMALPLTGTLESIAAQWRDQARGRFESAQPMDEATLAEYRRLYRVAWERTLGARLPAPEDVSIELVSAATAAGAGMVGSVRAAIVPFAGAVELANDASGDPARLEVVLDGDDSPAATTERDAASSRAGWRLLLRAHDAEPACNAGVALDDDVLPQQRRFPATYHRSELARRVQDVLSALAVLSVRSGIGPERVELVARGDAAAVALLARALAPGPCDLDFRGLDEAGLAAQPNYLALGGLEGAALLVAPARATLCAPPFPTAAIERAWGIGGRGGALRIVR